MNLYQLLGVDAAAEGAELARAYRRRLRQLHPDVRCAPGADPAICHGLDRDRLDPPPDLAAVQHAYQVLRDPTLRARYDAELRGHAACSSDRVGRRSTRTAVPIAVRVHPTRLAGPLIGVGRVRVDPLPPPPNP